MNLPDLKHDYYAALICEARLGPRRELNLSIELHQEGWRGESKVVAIRFGGIANFDEVHGFFEHFDLSASRWEGLHCLRYNSAHANKPGDLLLELQFDRTGDEVRICCRNVTVSDENLLSKF